MDFFFVKKNTGFVWRANEYLKDISTYSTEKIANEFFSRVVGSSIWMDR